MRAVQLVIRLGEDEAAAFVEQCSKELILPGDWIRRATGLKPKEPFLIEPPPAHVRSETKRMLLILEELWKQSPEAFAKAAQGVRGNSRLWFSTDPREIRLTGNSNKCAQIGTSPWWVSTNCPWNGMTKRIEKVMTGMGFSSAYIRMVECVVVGGVGRLWAGDYISK